MIYTTKIGDVLDRILWKFYGYDQGQARYLPTQFEHLFAPQPDPLPAGITAQVHELNPWLAIYGQKLPAGLSIILPETPTPSSEAQETFW